MGIPLVTCSNILRASCPEVASHVVQRIMSWCCVPLPCGWHALVPRPMLSRPNAMLAACPIVVPQCHDKSHALVSRPGSKPRHRGPVCTQKQRTQTQDARTQTAHTHHVHTQAHTQARENREMRRQARTPAPTHTRTPAHTHAHKHRHKYIRTH